MSSITMRKKELFWDFQLAEQVENVSIQLHRPTRKNVVLNCNKPWEGEHCCYGSLIFDGEKYRLYYRGAGGNDGVWKTDNGSHSLWCVAYSQDGKYFTKPELGIYEYRGSSKNNIIFMTSECKTDNFSVMLDKNPNCPSDARYKALSSRTDKEKVGYLDCYKSEDGIHFQFSHTLSVSGDFDSHNVLFWDESIQKYRLYFRGYHKLDPDHRIEYESEDHVRDVRLTLSDDMLHWSEPVFLDYGENSPEFQMYTSCISQCENARHFIGFPTRYINRSVDMENYEYLPDVGGFRPMLIEKYGRSGTAVTETMIMTSRDGIHFNRTPEAFLTPGIENGDNWVYGDGYFVHGMALTDSDFTGEPQEISIYTGTGYRARPVTFERYTIRTDGFFSWHSGYTEGNVLTKPLTLNGAQMTVNFATSALGYLHIRLCNQLGEPLEGYDSGRLFGNSLNRPCMFALPLTSLAGTDIRMNITMKDCDLFSISIN